MPEHAARRIVLCLDGTWNSAYNEQRRRDGHRVLKPSNVLKICRAVRPFAGDGTVQIAYYDIGVGSIAEYPGAANWLLYRSDRALGGAWGAGFEGNVEDALHFLAMNFEPGDEVYVFGFSRGAATARAITQFLDWNGGLPAKIDAYYLPILFRTFVTTKGDPQERTRLLEQIRTERETERPRRESLLPFHPVPVTYLGVWDTVMALGSRFKMPKGEKSFYVGTMPAACVAHARQALSIDERRLDFVPEVWAEARKGQVMEQRWFAGVHSNVGGGYTHDGLANIALRWIVEGTAGLDLDPAYLNHFGGYFGDSLYESNSRLYSALDWLRRRSGKRSLVQQPAAAHLELDRSVLLRMCAEKVQGANDEPSDRPYRPENVIEYLAQVENLPAWLRSIDIDQLPDDVMQQIRQLRKKQPPAQATQTAAAHP